MLSDIRKNHAAICRKPGEHHVKFLISCILHLGVGLLAVTVGHLGIDIEKPECYWLTLPALIVFYYLFLPIANCAKIPIGIIQPSEPVSLHLTIPVHSALPIDRNMERFGCREKKCVVGIPTGFI